MTVKKTDKELVESVTNMQKDLNDLTIDKINDLAPSFDDVPPQISAREKAKLENAQFIEPLRTLPALGTLPEKLKKEHAHAWEYVKGIYENYVVNGEPLRFWLSLYPGDKDCLWEIPANRPVFVPRMVAKHLEEVQCYHTFDYVEAPVHNLRADQFTHNFSVTGTHYRGKFRPIGAFA